MLKIKVVLLVGLTSMMPICITTKKIYFFWYRRLSSTLFGNHCYDWSHSLITRFFMAPPENVARATLTLYVWLILGKVWRWTIVITFLRAHTYNSDYPYSPDGTMNLSDRVPNDGSTFSYNITIVISTILF